MAELAIATGIIQVAGAGIALTRALYNFGATTSSAGEQTDFIGKNITLYCRVLKTLGQQLKVKQPDHTTEALDLAEELQEQSVSLFQKIQKLLPTPEGDRSGLSLKQRILWNFRRNRVDYLVGQVEYLKSTVNLLLNILSSVPKLRRHRRSKKKSRLETEEVKEALNEAQNSIYERCQAQRQLSTLAERAERDSAPMLPLAASTELAIASEVEINQQVIKSTGPTLRQIDSYAGGLSGSNDRAMIMQKTSSWVAQLYSQWTTLSEDVPLFDEATVADLTADMDPESALRVDSTFKASQSTGNHIGPEPLEVEQEDLSIHFEDGYHQYGVGTKCNCVRAVLKIPMSVQRELRDLDIRTTCLLDASAPFYSAPFYSAPFYPSTTSFLRTSERRNELEHTFNTQYLLPLYKKYLARLSDSLAVADSEIAELYRTFKDMTSAERHSAKAEVAARVAKRRRLSLLVKHNEFSTRKSEYGTIYLEPSDCLQPQRKTTEQPDCTATSSGSADMQLDPDMIFDMMGGSMDDPRERQAPASLPKSGGYSTDTPTSTRSQTMPFKRTDRVARVETPPMKYSESSDAIRGNGSDPVACDTESRKLGPEGMYNERRREDYFGSRESFAGSSRDRFEDEPPRAFSRKYEIPPERERRSSTKTFESSKSKKSGWDTGASGMSLKTSLKFQAKAKFARDRVLERKEQEKREKELDKEKKAFQAKLRDQEQRRDMTDKARQRVYIEDDSSGDSDMAVHLGNATIRGPRSSMRQEEHRRLSERSRRQRDDEDDEDDEDDDDDDKYADLWQERHKGAAEYLASSGRRPTMGRS